MSWLIPVHTEMCLIICMLSSSCWKFKFLLDVVHTENNVYNIYQREDNVFLIGEVVYLYKGSTACEYISTCSCFRAS